MSQIPELMGGRRLEHGAVSDEHFISRGGPSEYATLFTDFFYEADQSVELPFSLEEAGSTNATIAPIDAANGIIRLAHTADNEAQAVGITTDGLSAIDPTKSPIFECRAAINLNTDSAFDSDSVYEVYLGLAIADQAVATTDAAVDGFSDVAMFKLGPNGTNSIMMETDDDSTHNTDVDSGIDFTSGTFHVYRIDMSSISNVKFYVDGKLANNGNTFNMSNIAAGDLLEPYILFKRSAAGTERAHTMDVDYVHCSWKR